MPSTNPMILAFHNHKGRAVHSGIGFEFSFEEWKEWWHEQLGPDWIKKRGRRRGQHVMARVGDTGPYHPSLVKCVTCGQNNSEAIHLREERHCWVKLTKDQVIEARRLYVPYCSEFGVRALARRYGVGHSAMRACLTGDHWSRVGGAHPDKKERPLKLTPEIVREARRRYKPGDPVDGATAMGREFGVAHSSMWDAITGKTWQHA